jgi:hypothetical protein
MALSSPNSPKIISPTKITPGRNYFRYERAIFKNSRYDGLLLADPYKEPEVIEILSRAMSKNANRKLLLISIHPLLPWPELSDSLLRNREGWDGRRGRHVTLSCDLSSFAQ